MILYACYWITVMCFNLGIRAKQNARDIRIMKGAILVSARRSMILYASWMIRAIDWSTTTNALHIATATMISPIATLVFVRTNGHLYVFYWMMVRPDISPTDARLSVKDFLIISIAPTANVSNMDTILYV